MDPTLSRSRVRAFTLLELLCVLAIIGLLAALLLPAVSQAGARAKRVQCLQQLHQIGVAFHAFAHDHNSQFPMTVPANNGGTREFLAGATSAPGDFYFSFRHFQALSNELTTPKVLVCPSDNRPAAVDFSALKNDNLSYFVGLRAEYDLPTSILAGDRNVTNDWTSASPVVRLSPQHFLRWTDELHRFKGNLLFADAHATEMNSPGFTALANQLQTTSIIGLPQIRPPGQSSRGLGAGWPGPAAGGVNQAVSNQETSRLAELSHAARSSATPDATQQLVAVSSVREQVRPFAGAPNSEGSAAPATNPVRLLPPQASNSTSSPVVAPTDDSWLYHLRSWFASIVHGTAGKRGWFICALLLLLLLVTWVIRERYLTRKGRPKPRG